MRSPCTRHAQVGSRYVARLQLQGVTSIGQFSAMAATPDGRAALCRLCKGDNPRNSLNDLKLQAAPCARAMHDVMYDVMHGVVHDVQCTVCSARCAVHGVQCTMTARPL